MITQKKSLISCDKMIMTKAITAMLLLIGAVTAATTNLPTVAVTVTPASAAAALPIATTPTGIFYMSPQAFADSAANAVAAGYDDYDVYIPYRSDIHDYFSWDLLQEVLQNEPNNAVISPFSVKLVLALLLEAAGNNTKTQKELLTATSDIRAIENIRSFYKKTLTGMKRENPFYTLHLETKLFTDEFIEPQQRYAALLESHYFTQIERLQFADALSSAARINEWCSNATRGRLQQLVTEDKIQNSVMILANAIYFNGKWRHQFNETFDSVFFRTPNEQIKATYMEQTEYFYHYDSNVMDARILRLPYKGRKFSMFIVLPKTKGGLSELVRSVQNEELKKMQWMMEEIKIKVTIPKFKFDYNTNLKSTLRAMGIAEIFTQNASMPGLARGSDVAGKLKVSNIFQKAGIDVNEKGTEAYASTVVEIENKFGGTTDIEEFNVNRPFLFFIEEEATGNIIFAGKVTEPFI